MQLSALRDRLEAIAEREVRDLPFMEAVRWAIGRIEGEDQRLVHYGQASLTTTGDSLYRLPPGVKRKDVKGVRYVYPGDGGYLDLVQKDWAMPGTSGPEVPSYYDFIAPDLIQLDAYPNGGELRFSVRAYREAELSLDSEVEYPALQWGVLSFLGRNSWQDDRGKEWEATFQQALLDMLGDVWERGSDIGNLGER